MDDAVVVGRVAGVAVAKIDQVAFVEIGEGVLEFGIHLFQGDGLGEEGVGFVKHAVDFDLQLVVAAGLGFHRGGIHAIAHAGDGLAPAGVVAQQYRGIVDADGGLVVKIRSRLRDQDCKHMITLF